MPTVYQIERQEINLKGKVIKTDILPIEYTDLLACNLQIVRFAEIWKSEHRRVQHNAGQSIVYFSHCRVEFTRLPSFFKES